MTDFSSSLNTHTASLLDSIGSVPAPVKIVHTPQHTALAIDEDEDYTIKCICRFQDDDGNTVFCDRCETWQHIECYYYHDGMVLDVSKIDHLCADCEPRPLDAKSATERQSVRREQPNPGERKVKKPTTKSHKKKIKIPDSNAAITNGWSHDKNDRIYLHDRTSRSPRDQAPPAKRPKTSHRLSSSVNSPMIPFVPPTNFGKRSGSASRTNQSPSKTPNNHQPNGYPSENYSLEFLQLYDNDPGDAPMQANLFNDITITRSLSLWSHDVESLSQAANGLSPQDVFHRCDQPLDSMSLPRLNKQHKQHAPADSRSLPPTWTFLTIDSYIPKDSIVGELKGKVGHMQDYVQDPANRWDYLRHPVPFVFFHPKLPIYIDTRCEGTSSRYLRRSCRPNLSMKTILENGSDYHFCFVAKTDLEAGCELTIGWVWDQHIRNFFFQRSNDEIKPEGTVDAEEEYVTDWVGKVLADFGGCACDAPSQCALARYDRRNGPSPMNAAAQFSNGSIKRGRNGHTIKTSPPSTGYATNSRAVSEGAKHQEAEDGDDSRSTSGSARSKPRSRDLTPSRSTFDHSGIAPGEEISLREKRKIAQMERKFEQLEEGKHQPAHKKKIRHSGGSNLNTPSVGTSKQLGHTNTSLSQPNTPGISCRPRYMDVSTSRRQSGSPATTSSHNFAVVNFASASAKRTSHPNTPSTTSPLVRQNYVNSSMQTDADENDDWYSPATASILLRRPYVSLTKRLLMRCQKDRARLEKRTRAASASSANSPASSRPPNTELRDPPDVDMVDDFVPNDLADSEMQSVGLGLALNLDHTELPLNHLPVQKPRPPDQAPNLPDPLEPVHSKPLSLSFNSYAVQPSDNQVRPLNGCRPSDLRVQLPATPKIFHGSTPDTTATVTPSFIASRSPFLHISNSYPPLPSSSASNMAQSSPVKKKVSLGEYMSRKNKAESQSSAERHMNSSPVLQQSTLKPLPSLDEEVKEVTMEATAIVETPRMEEGDPIDESKDPKL